MAKFHGTIIYVLSKETSPDVWEEQTIEREYSGDILRSYKKYSSNDKINDDIKFFNEISIVADPFAFENFVYMKYIVYMNHKWKIQSVELKYPRLIITPGG